MRSKRFLYNNISAILGQIITIVCGLILPKAMMKGFGSEIYGATTSIADFLGYIALIEGGIGGVARAALYKPLAEKNFHEINKIVASIQQFFRKIAIIFIGYTLVIACSYSYIAKDYPFDWGFTFWLVIIISFSSLAEYYFGITYSVLLQADQKRYITQSLQSITIILNTILACILIYFECNILTVKLSYCVIHGIRIIILNKYIKNNYYLKKMPAQNGYLSQKWDGMGQHIAFFLHSKTDIAVLTLFMNLREVAVYSVYNYIVSSLVALSTSFVSGVESVFGDMLAKNEKDNLNHFFNIIELVVHTICIIFFSTAAIMIMPFIKLYTNGISDADYYRPEIAYVMLLAEAFFCFRQPYGQLATAAGKFKETKNAAFIEAALNIVLSCIFAYFYGVAGIVTATLIAMTYRTAYYVYYMSKYVIKRKALVFVRRLTLTCINTGVIFFICRLIPFQFETIKNYFEWVIYAVMTVCISCSITVAFSYIFYKQEWKQLVKQITGFVRSILIH